MQVNKVRFPAGTKVAIGFFAFLAALILLLGFIDLLGLLILLAYAFGALLALALVYLLIIRLTISVGRRLALRADLWFTRTRARKGHLPKDFCLLLRSTQADIALSIDDGDGTRIRDPGTVRIDVAPGFRALLAHRMTPLYTVLVKNSEEVQDVVSVTYRDDAWKAQILDDIASCTLILILPLWPSPALAWELEQIRERGHLRKAFVVMPPAYLFRPGLVVQPSFLDRVNDRLRFMLRETLEAMAPDYFIDTRHAV